MATAHPWIRVVLLLIVGLLVVACGATPPTARPSGAGAGAGPSGKAAGATSEPTDPPLAHCRASDLRARITGWRGASGSRYASVAVTSGSGITCTVRGTPGVRLLDGKGKVVLDSAKIKGIGGPRIASGADVVVIGTGDTVTLDVQWSNWCSTQPTRPLTVALVLTDGGGLLKAAKPTSSGADDAPPCGAKAKPAQLRVTHAWSGPGI